MAKESFLYKNQVKMQLQILFTRLKGKIIKRAKNKEEFKFESGTNDFKLKLKSSVYIGKIKNKFIKEENKHTLIMPILKEKNAPFNVLFFLIDNCTG